VVAPADRTSSASTSGNIGRFATSSSNPAYPRGAAFWLKFLGICAASGDWSDPANDTQCFALKVSQHPFDDEQVGTRWRDYDGVCGIHTAISHNRQLEVAAEYFASASP
jgi:hypothetical protein